MTSIIKSLIARTRKSSTAEDQDNLQRANQTLQFRAQQIARVAPAHVAPINGKQAAA